MVSAAPPQQQLVQPAMQQAVAASISSRPLLMVRAVGGCNTHSRKVTKVLRVHHMVQVPVFGSMAHTKALKQRLCFRASGEQLLRQTRRPACGSPLLWTCHTQQLLW